jgi:hypothetical protein
VYLGGGRGGDTGEGGRRGWRVYLGVKGVISCKGVRGIVGGESILQQGHTADVYKMFLHMTQANQVASGWISRFLSWRLCVHCRLSVC